MFDRIKRLIKRTPAQVTGAAGEDLAAAELVNRGYTIIERNFRGRGGEIDIIARDGGELVFVEVKTRRNFRFGMPEEAVGKRKADCISRTAMDYWLQKRLRGLVVRCDIVSVMLFQDRPAEIVVFKDAVSLKGNFF